MTQLRLASVEIRYPIEEVEAMLHTLSRRHSWALIRNCLSLVSGNVQTRPDRRSVRPRLERLEDKVLLSVAAEAWARGGNSGTIVDQQWGDNRATASSSSTGDYPGYPITFTESGTASGTNLGVHTSANATSAANQTGGAPWYSYAPYGEMETGVTISDCFVLAGPSPLPDHVTLNFQVSSSTTGQTQHNTGQVYVHVRDSGWTNAQNVFDYSGALSLNVPIDSWSGGGDYTAYLRVTVVTKDTGSVTATGTVSLTSVDLPEGYTIQFCSTQNLPDISPAKPTLTADGGVDLGYSISTSPLPSATNVSLYWASGTTFDTAIGGVIYSETTQTAVGSYGPFHVAASALGSPPSGAKYLLAVADPDNDVDEADEGNNVQFVEPLYPDLAVTDLSQTSEGGVRFTYEVNAAPASGDSNVALYWAKGEQYSDRLGGPVYTTTIDPSVGFDRVVEVPHSVFVGEDPPRGTTHLLVVMDDNSKTHEADETNNFKAMTLPNIRAIKLSYNEDRDGTAGNAKHRGVDFGYAVDEADLTASPLVSFYWGDAAGKKLPGGYISTVKTTYTQQGPHSRDTHPIEWSLLNEPGNVFGREWGKPPETARSIVAVFDPDKRVLEANPETNEYYKKDNERFVPLTPAEEIRLDLWPQPLLAEDAFSIVAPFNPRKGTGEPISLSEAEIAFGVDHFNWFQTVAAPAPPGTPYWVYETWEDGLPGEGTLVRTEAEKIDPVVRLTTGSIYQVYARVEGLPDSPRYAATGIPSSLADAYVFYLNEDGVAPEWSVKGPAPLQWYGTFGPKEMRFYDRPYMWDWMYGGNPDRYLSFSTTLVGVGYGQDHPLMWLGDSSQTTFTWKSNSITRSDDGSGGGGIVYDYPIPNDVHLIGGGIFEVRSGDGTLIPGFPTDPPPLPHPPVLGAIGDRTTTVGTPLTFKASASDPDPESVLTFALAGAPSGATIATDTGVFTWTPTANQGPGDYSFTVQVTDGIFTDEEAVTVHVFATVANEPPKFAPIADQTIDEGHTLGLALSATDDPAQTLTYALVSGPAGMAVDPATGVLTWSPADGPFTAPVTVRVTDDAAVPLSDEVSFTVTARNVAPTATFSAPPAATVGVPATFRLTDPIDVPADAGGLRYSYDLDGDGAFELADAGPQASFTYLAPGTYTARGRVEDKDGDFTDYAASVVVTPAAPATLTITGPATGVRGQPRLFTFTLEGVAGPAEYRIDWGDGAVETLTAGPALAREHVYAATGDFTVTAQAAGQAAQRPIRIAAMEAQPDPVDPARLALVVGGTAGQDVVLVMGNGAAATVLLNGVTAAVPGVARVVVYAGGGDDVVMASGSLLPVWVFGGGGDDVVFGGQAGDLLSGEAGDDVLYGLAGDDVLLGGAGADVLFSGPGEDLMVGGPTAFDLSAAALAAVCREWQSGRPYEQRVANLRGNPSSPAFSDRLNGGHYLKAAGPDATVFDDGEVDTLVGQGGRDWLFASLDGATADLLWGIDRHSRVDSWR